MDTQMDKKISKIHFIGVGGVGMSGIARVAADQGMQVSGSDLRSSRYTDQLEEAGVTVFIGQDAQNVPEDVDVVVVSTAILDTNPELIEAKRRDVPIWHRAKMLAELGRDKRTLAVAGTHGKTTSSSMVATALDGMGFDPTFLIGGIVSAYESNARSGQGEFYVVEADESDKSFTYLSPESVLVTNVEADHLDHYEDLAEIYSLFSDFMSSVPEDGTCVVCNEDKPLVEVARKTGRKVITYGFDDTADSVVRHYRTEGIASFFDVELPDKTVVFASLSQNPGLHNALNAAGVLTLIWSLGMDVEAAAEALCDFKGVKRRFDLVGKVDDITIVDDYAHHPTEIAATIKAAKELGFSRIHVLFQPHRYSRVKLFTEVLRDDFACAFDDADLITFMGVYSAGEAPVPGISGATFMEPVKEHLGGSKPLTYVAKRMDVVPYLVEKLEPGDLIITMGAGDVTSIGPELKAALQDSRCAAQ